MSRTLREAFENYYAGVFVITVPMPELQTNRRHGRSRHWRAAHRDKVKYWEQLDLHAAAKLILPPPATPIARAWVSSVMYLGGAMDDDNAIARHKPLLDWLKKRRYIVDDRRKCLRWSALPDQVVKRDDNYRIVLTLTPCDSFDTFVLAGSGGA